MNILDRVESVRKQARCAGSYRVIAEKSGVGYEWLAKFARGAIVNPSVDKIHKLEQYFEIENLSHDHPAQ